MALARKHCLRFLRVSGVDSASAVSMRSAVAEYEAGDRRGAMLAGVREGRAADVEREAVVVDVVRVRVDRLVRPDSEGFGNDRR